MSVASFTGVVPLLLVLVLLYAAVLQVGLVPRCVQNGTHTQYAHTETPFVCSCHQTKTSNYGCCFTVAAAASKSNGVIQAHSSIAADSTAKVKSCKNI